MKRPARAERTGLEFWQVGLLLSAAPEVRPAPQHRITVGMRNEELWAGLDRLIGSLFWRAHRLSEDRWTREPPQFELPMEIERNHAEKRAIIRKLLASPRKKERAAGERCANELRELDREEASRAAARLAFAGRTIAEELSALAHQRPELLREVASRFPSWPVNMALGRPDAKGQRKLLGADATGEYLRKLEVGKTPQFPASVILAPDHTAHLPRVAAERVLGLLQAVRQNPQDFIRINWESEDAFARRWRRSRKARPDWTWTPTPWAKKLLALEWPPSTKEQVQEWWRVAKVFLDEQWEVNPKFFQPLATKLKLDLDQHTLSMVKRRVIDDSLKKAFKAVIADKSRTAL